MPHVLTCFDINMQERQVLGVNFAGATRGMDGTRIKSWRICCRCYRCQSFQLLFDISCLCSVLDQETSNLGSNLLPFPSISLLHLVSWGESHWARRKHQLCDPCLQSAGTKGFQRWGQGRWIVSVLVDVGSDMYIISWEIGVMKTYDSGSNLTNARSNEARTDVIW